jgi:hypothetical protein
MPRQVSPKIEVNITEGNNELTAEQVEFIKRSIQFYEDNRERCRAYAKKKYVHSGKVGRPKKNSTVENLELVI